MLKDGELFVVFDILRLADGPIRYPVPWASSPDTSSVDDSSADRGALEFAGFRVTHERGRRIFALDFTEACHGADGSNRPAAPRPSPPARRADAGNGEKYPCHDETRCH